MRIAYDVELQRPGCVLIQATLGCDADVSMFPAGSWLVHLTDGLKVYEVTEAQLETLRWLPPTKEVT